MIRLGRLTESFCVLRALTFDMTICRADSKETRGYGEALCLVETIEQEEVSYSYRSSLQIFSAIPDAEGSWDNVVRG